MQKDNLFVQYAFTRACTEQSIVYNFFNQSSSPGVFKLRPVDHQGATGVLRGLENLIKKNISFYQRFQNKHVSKILNMFNIILFNNTYTKDYIINILFCFQITGQKSLILFYLHSQCLTMRNLVIYHYYFNGLYNLHQHGQRNIQYIIQR